MTSVDHKNHQGGKAFGALKKQQSEQIDDYNKEFIASGTYEDVEDLPEQLENLKAKFIDYDVDDSGDLDMMDVKIMMEKLGQAKTHLEIKKMIAEVDSTKKGAINYVDFVKMMLGKRNGILKMIIMFEAMGKESEKPKGVPAKKSLDELP